MRHALRQKAPMLLCWLRLGLAAWIAFWPSPEVWAAGDQTTTATASGTVATVYAVAVSGNITLGSIPADATSWTATQTNTLTATNNENASWYVKLKINSAVPGATLQAKGADVAGWTTLTESDQTFKSVTVNPINTPNDTTDTYSYQAQSDGALTGAASVSWAITYTLTQTL